MNITRCPVCRQHVESPDGRFREERQISATCCDRCLYLNFLTGGRGFPARDTVAFRKHTRNEFALLPISLRVNPDPRFTGAGVTIAFIDSGFFPHPDLITPLNRILAFVDVTDDKCPPRYFRSPQAESWHGTMSAVIASGAGTLSKGLYKGIAREASMVCIKTMKRKSRHVSGEDIARGIWWAIDHKEEYGIRIINIAVGADGPELLTESDTDQAVEAAVESGIVVVSATGNAPGHPFVAPASAPSAITVGGLDDRNQLHEAFWTLYPSTYGKTMDGIDKPDILAPATHLAGPILPKTDQYRESRLLLQLLHATEAGARSMFTRHKKNLPELSAKSTRESMKHIVRKRIEAMKYIAPYHKSMEGTSVAAAIVTSIVAQMLQANPALTPAEIKDILARTARPLQDSSKERQGNGVIDARAAIEQSVLARHPLILPGIHRSADSFAFLYEDRKAETVALAGDFNGWDPLYTPFHGLRNGLWSCIISKPSDAQLSYKFVIDGRRWIPDPANRNTVADGFGGWNSRL